MVNLKILLAEDNVSTARMYQQIMESKGFTVDYASDGQAAVDLAKEGGYDLILLDIRMPKLDGIEVLEKIHDLNPEEKNGPIVMLTNLTEEVLVKKAMSMGALSYVDKSNLNPQQLVDKIHGVLGLPMQAEE